MGGRGKGVSTRQNSPCSHRKIKVLALVKNICDIARSSVYKTETKYANDLITHRYQITSATSLKQNEQIIKFKLRLTFTTLRQIKQINPNNILKYKVIVGISGAQTRLGLLFKRLLDDIDAVTLMCNAFHTFCLELCEFI